MVHSTLEEKHHKDLASCLVWGEKRKGKKCGFRDRKNKNRKTEATETLRQSTKWLLSLLLLLFDLGSMYWRINKQQQNPQLLATGDYLDLCSQHSEGWGWELKALLGHRMSCRTARYTQINPEKRRKTERQTDLQSIPRVFSHPTPIPQQLFCVLWQHHSLNTAEDRRPCLGHPKPTQFLAQNHWKPHNIPSPVFLCFYLCLLIPC